MDRYNAMRKRQEENVAALIIEEEFNFDQQETADEEFEVGKILFFFLHLIFSWNYLIEFFFEPGV